MITFRTLHIDELEKWFDFLAGDIFKDAPRELFESQWYRDQNKDINGIFVAVDEEGNFVSTLRVFIREVYINGYAVSCGGIGSVGTREEYRGQRLPAVLFEMSLKYMREKDIHVSFLLCGEHKVKFYNRHGYTKSPLLTKISSINKCADCSCDYSIVDVDFERDTAALYDIYTKFSGEFNGSVVRSMEYWKEWIEADKNYNYKIVRDAESKEIAYISYAVEGSKILVTEFGCLPEHNNIFDSLIARIGRNVSGDNLKVVYQMLITSGMQVEDYWEPCCIMYKLITPFSRGSLKIDSTEKLLETIKGDGDISRVTLWPVDDI